MKRPTCKLKCLTGHRNYAGQLTSLSLAVTVSVPRSLLPILFFFGWGIDAMFSALPLSLPTAFPKLFTHTTRVGWSLYPSRSIMSEAGRVTGKGPLHRRKTCPQSSGWLTCPFPLYLPRIAGLHPATTRSIAKLHHVLFSQLWTFPTNLKKTYTNGHRNKRCIVKKCHQAEEKRVSCILLTSVCM